MKYKVFFLTLILSTLSLIGCSKEDDYFKDTSIYLEPSKENINKNNVDSQFKMGQFFVARDIQVDPLTKVQYIKNSYGLIERRNTDGSLVLYDGDVNTSLFMDKNSYVVDPVTNVQYLVTYYNCGKGCTDYYISPRFNSDETLLTYNKELSEPIASPYFTWSDVIFIDPITKVEYLKTNYGSNLIPRYNSDKTPFVYEGDISHFKNKLDTTMFLIDPITRIQYIYLTGGGITPRLQTDGSLVIYDGSLEKAKLLDTSMIGVDPVTNIQFIKTYSDVTFRYNVDGSIAVYNR